MAQKIAVEEVDAQRHARCGLLLCCACLEGDDSFEEVRWVVSELILELRVDREDVAEAMHGVVLQSLLAGPLLVLNQLLLQNSIT